MDIIICQSCGIIIRGKSKFCTSCGATISRFSPTPLPVITQAAAPLAAGFDPDPIALERAINKMQLAHAGIGTIGGNGHGNGNGNGHGNGHEELYGSSADESVPQVSKDSLMSTSRLSSILGAAVSQLPGSAPRQMNDMISLGEDENALTSSGSQPQVTFPMQAAAKNTGNIDRFTFDDEPDDGSTATLSPIPKPASPAISGNFATLQAMQGQAEVDPSQSSAESTIYTSAPAVFEQPPEAVSPSMPATSFPASPNYSEAALFPSVANTGAVATNSYPDQQMPLPEPAPASVFDAPTLGPSSQATFSPRTQSLFDDAQTSSRPAVPAPVYNAGADPAFAQPPASVMAVLAGGGIAVCPVSNAGAAAIFNEPIPKGTVRQEDKGPDIPDMSITGSQPMFAPQALASAESTFFSFSPPPDQAPAAETKPPETAPAAAPASAGLFDSMPSMAGTAVPPATAQSAESAVEAVPEAAPAPAPTAASFDFFASSPGLSGAPAASAQQAAPTSAPSTGSSDDLFNSLAGAPSIVTQAIKAAQAAGTSFAPPTMDEFERSMSGGTQSPLREKGEEKDSDKREERSSYERPKSRFSANEEDRPKEPKDSFITIGNFSMSKKMTLTLVVLVAFVGIPFFTVVSSLLGGGGGSSNPAAPAKSTGINLGSIFQSASGPNLSGKWELGYLDLNGKSFQGTINITHKGAELGGWGVDRMPFQIKGTVNYPNVTFNKQYVMNNQAQGKPILYGGRIDWLNEHPEAGPPYMHVAGIWKLTRREGHGWRGQVVTRTNRFEMQQIQRATVDGEQHTLANNVPAPSVQISMGGGGGGGFLQVPASGDREAWSAFFLKIAGGLILFGAVLVFISLKMFGPSGNVNIWAKKEYIPSQFKSQHYKMVAELGKPLRPGGLPLGNRSDWNIFQFFRARKLALPPEIRDNNPHVIILGAGQKGKSRLMATMVAHDIESNDRAVVVIDSDGGLIDLVMSWIGSHPKGKEIAKRVLIIDPTHGTDGCGYNPLEFPDDGDLQNAASAIVFGFKAIYTEPPGAQSQWTQQTANILRNAAMLLMANNKTLTDLPSLLSENDFRDVLLEKVERLRSEKAEYTTLLEAWAQYKRLARTDQWINWVEPILNRVLPMLGDPRIRPILTKATGDLNLKQIIKEGKVLFVKVPQSQLDQNANLLGSLIVTGLKQAAMSLSIRGNSKRHPCALYLDEFDTFIEKETYDAITSETKKFQIGFIGASKTLQGLPEDYRNQLIINCGTMCCFALAKKDGDLLGPQMFRVDGRKIKHQTLQNIFNKVNTSPQFELISDEEKLNIDRVVGQDEKAFFCYRVGTVAGVFSMTSPEFKDISDKDVNWGLIDEMYGKSQSKDS